MPMWIEIFGEKMSSKLSSDEVKKIVFVLADKIANLQFKYRYNLDENAVQEAIQLLEKCKELLECYYYPRDLIGDVKLSKSRSKICEIFSSGVHFYRGEELAILGMFIALKRMWKERDRLTAKDLQKYIDFLTLMIVEYEMTKDFRNCEYLSTEEKKRLVEAKTRLISKYVTKFLNGEDFYDEYTKDVLNAVKEGFFEDQKLQQKQSN